MVMAICPSCDSSSLDQFKHVHNCVHGMPQTHLSGSERFQCRECRFALSREEAKVRGLVYTIDVDDDAEA